MASNVYIAINQTKVVNSERSFALLRETGPKMCMLTASQPGFLGYQAQYQLGVLPLAGRYGGGELRMQLNPLPIYQYTVWDQEVEHVEFHQKNFARVFELCAHCLPVIVEGPWEPVYRIVSAQMPEIRTLGQIGEMVGAMAGKAQAGAGSMRFATPQRVVALDERLVKPGEERAFEVGAIAVMEALARSPGFLGYMVLEEVGVNPWGSLMLDPQSMLQMVQTFGAHPPATPQPLFEEAQVKATPARYLIHSEWESPELAQLGIGKLGINRKVRMLHTERVMPHVMRGPYVMLFQPMMEEPSWREAL